MNTRVKILLGMLLGLFFSLHSLGYAAENSAQSNAQKSFDTPDEALKALMGAYELASDDGELEILGSQYKEFVQKDREVYSIARKKLVNLAKEHFRISTEGDKAIANLGIRAWPFPIPMVKKGNRWLFDMTAGKEEILNRRTGHNELAAIMFCEAYVDAQRKYASQDHTGDNVLKYAQTIFSTKGKFDGLYWETAPGEILSPLASVLDVGEDFRAGTGTEIPYHGYYFKILTKQGDKAPNGKYDYVINGNMIAGFALIAWPVEYGSSGVMTFMVNHQGIVYQKKLGRDTATLAKAIDEYNPDATWIPVKP